MKTPQPIFDAAVRFSPAVLSGAIGFDEAHDILMQVIERHFPEAIDDIGQIVIEALGKRSTELECAASDTVRKWIAPLIAARAPKQVLLGAARGASQLYSYNGLPYLTEIQIKRIIENAVRDAIGRHRAVG